VFNGNGHDSGKIIFLGLSPRRTYDIAYYCNRDVLIDVNTQETGMTAGAGTDKEFYVVRLSTLNAELAKPDLSRLEESDIEYTLKVIAGFQCRSSYSWRFVPVGPAL
jgi:hypothetical protein